MSSIFLLGIINLLVICLIIKYFRFLLRALERYWNLLKGSFKKPLTSLATFLEKAGEHLKSSLLPELPVDNDHLTPYANAEAAQVYTDILTKKVKIAEVKNIALTGAYGSGKSSILRTFQHLHPEFRYLNISLAAFNDAKPTTTNTEDPEDVDGKLPKPKIKAVSKVDIAAIEYSILQQIFYHVKHQKIPFSRFKRIKNLPGWLLWIRAVLLICWIGAVVFLLWHEKLLAEKDSHWDRWVKWPPERTAILLLGFVLLYAIYVIYIIFRVYNNSEFHKLNLTSGEVEIKPASELSILNKHLDELVYFFEVTHYNVLIIEDLDRFNNADIFVHLRELNTLINNSKQIGRKITFIYALKDEVFKDEKRTKFFDYIIPVIPIIDNKNSAGILDERLRRMGVKEEEVAFSFLSDICYYIDDMRLLINTANEFDIYRKKLHENPPESYTRLLAMMVFKNKYPKLFANLQKRKGLAYKVLTGRSEFLRTITADTRKRQALLDELLQQNQDLHQRNLRELRTVYAYQLSTHLPDNVTELVIGNTNEQLKIRELADDGQLEKLFTEKPIRFIRSNMSISSTGKTFASIAAEVDAEQTYQIRESALKAKFSLRHAQLEDELAEINLSLDKMDQRNLKELLAIRSLKDLDAKLATNGLLTFLVTQGYLSEDYHYYLSHFYPGSLTRTDLDFIFALKEQKSLPFDYVLEKTEELYRRLQLSDYQAQAAYNNKLIDYLLEQKPDKREIAILIQRLASGNKEAVKFILQYLRVGKQPATFVKLLGKAWPRLWQWIKFESKVREETQLDYLMLILANCKPGELPHLNVAGSLADTLNTKADFVTWALKTLNNDKIIKVIESLDLRFTQLEDLDGKSPVFDFILRSNHFDINPHMISMIMRASDPLITKEQLSTANLSTIVNSDVLALKEFIAANITYYLDRTWLQLPESRIETTEAMLWLLKQEELTPEDAQTFIENNNTRIDDITKADERSWEYLLSHSRMDATWQNVAKVYEKQDFSPELFLFLNHPDNYENLAHGDLKTDSGLDEAKAKAFAEKLMYAEQLELPALKQLLKSFDFYFGQANLTGISYERAKLLFENDRYLMRSPIYQQLQQSFDGLQLIYIENNKEQFFEIIDELVLMASDYQQLFKSAWLSDEDTNALIDRFDVSLFNESTALANQLGTLILKPTILPELNMQLLTSMFSYSEDLLLKIRIMLKYLTQLSESQAGALLMKTGDQFAQIANYKNPKFEKDDTVKALLDALKSKAIFVTKVEPIKDKLQVYTKMRPRS